MDTPGDLPEAEDALALEMTVKLMERLQGKPFPRGYNPDIEHVAFTREALHFSHRLLMFYVAVKVAQMTGHGFLRLMGHRRYLTPTRNLVYWHRPCQQQEGSVKQPPLIFFHGISPGRLVRVAGGEGWMVGEWVWGVEGVDAYASVT